MSSGPNKNNRNKNLLAAKHALGLATGSVGSSHTARSTHTSNTVYTSHSRASTSTSGRFSESKSGGGGGVSAASGSASAASRSTVGTAGSSGIFTLAPSASGRYGDITERFGSKSTGQTAASTVTATSASASSSGAASKSSRLSQIHDLSAAARQHARRFSESSSNLLTEERIRPRGVGGDRGRFLAGSTGQHTANTGVSSLSASMHSDVDDVNSINNSHNHNNHRRRGSHTSLSVDQLIYLEEEESHDDSMMGIRATAIGRGGSSVSTARERRASLNSLNNVNGSSQSTSHDTSLNISNMNSSSNMNIHNMGRKNTENSNDSILNNVMEKSSSVNNVYEKKVSFHERDLTASTAGSSTGGRRKMSDAFSDADTFGDSSVALVSYSGREIGNLEDELNDDDFSEDDIANENQKQNQMENERVKADDEENDYNESNLSKNRANVEEDDFTTNDGESSQFSQSQQYSQYSESQQYSQYSESQQYSQYSQSRVSQESQPESQYSQSQESQSHSQSQSQSQSQHYGDSPHDHSQSILSNTDTFSTFSSNASDTFVPQRFEEMRSLLLGITPLQLEALMMEIFGDDTPVGWKGIGQGGVPSGRSRRNKNPVRRFRKDAYLSEMTLEELMHFSHGMNLVGIESCETHEDAMDLIAIEFERLVSVHQNRPEEGGADGSSATASEYTDQSGSQFSRKRKQLRNASSSSFSEKDASSYNSAGSSIVDDEGENLRRSLRACSVPELRLVAERLQLDHTQCGNKEELISLIESSMPGMLGRAGSGSGNQGSMQGSIVSSSSRGDESSAGYYLQQEKQPQTQSQQFHQQPQQQQIQLYDPNQANLNERNRKVSFAKDCKADTSHLVEPRDMSKQTAWQSFVVTGDVEHGEESESKNLMPSDGSGDDDDDWINPEKSSNESDTSKKRKRFLGLFVVLCIIGLGVGLGVGLTKKGDGGASGSNLIIPDSGYFDFPYRPTAKPTLNPSAKPDAEESENYEEPEPGEAGSNVAVVIVREPTSSAPTTTMSPTPEITIAAMETNPPTVSPVTSEPSETVVVPATPIPTENFGPIPTSPPTPPPTIAAIAQTSQPTPGPSTYVDPSPPPTPLSPYPLLGPFDEVGMRIILYGVGELSNMGRTQWHMLTAAYLEQFFNVEGQGVDAIQNIVFDVVCNIEISDQELLSVSTEGASGRSLQDVSVILTFTTTISYRTFSESLTPDTVAERPFVDEHMRLDYVQFLSENNAAQFVGDVLGVSAIFRGDDVPETPSEFLPSINNTPPPVSSAPTVRPTVGYVDNTTLGPTPSPTQTTIIEIQATETPISQEPSRATTRSPSPKPNPSPTPRPTEYPTQNSFDIPSPTTPAPTQAMLSTPYPTSPAPSQVNLSAPYPTPRPSGSALSTPYPTQNALFGPINSFPPTANKMFSNDSTYPPTQYRLFVPADASVSPAPSAAPFVSATISRPRPRPVPLMSPIKQTPDPTSINTAAQIITEQPTGGPTGIPSTEPTNIPTGKPTMPPRITRTRPPSSAPTNAPSNSSSYNPSTTPPTIDCALVVTPICPFLTEKECCHPMCMWDFTTKSCLFMNSKSDHEVEWIGEVEVGQTHVVKAKGETRHAPRLIAHREAELLFTPSSVNVARRLRSSKTAVVVNRTMHSPTEQRLESIGEVYVSRENNEEVPANLERLAKHLIDGSETIFSVPNYIPDLDIVLDLMSLRRVSDVSIFLTENTIFSDVRIGVRFDDGRNQDESEDLVIPKSGWIWHDVRFHEAHVEKMITTTFLSRQVRYIMIRLKGGHSKTSQSWGLSGIEVVGYLDGLAEKKRPQEKNVSPMTRSFSQPTSRFYIPSILDFIRVAVYASDGRLLGVLRNVRDPSKQRDILERKLSATEIDPYSDTAWSVTIPHPWIEEGNTILIGCINESRPLELLVHRLELSDLAQFSEHTITRTKLAIFGDKDDVAKLNYNTIEAKRLVRNLFSTMPVAELKWADTELWHLPYLVVMGPDGPALVNSEEQRRTVTGEGEEISWDVMKNFLTIRHALAQSGMGFVETSDKGSNSPYASGTSLFMGWSLSRNEGDSWHWEDLGYWDTLAAAAWTGWCAMKAGDECSNYLIHEMGHAQSMQHFNAGSAENWGISDEYPNDGVMLPSHPWGYDSVSRRFRTWFDPLDGSGKLDPLNREGEGPTSQSCFSQYTPYQAKKSQEWALSTPILLSASSSHVPKDGAYQFNHESKEYVELKGQSFLDALGESAMQPLQVGVPVVTIVGTIGIDQEVCQTYPALRSRSGNTFQFPDPFSPNLPAAFNGAAHFVEVRFEDGSAEKALVASKADSMKEKTLEFYSFNVALDRRPIAVDLYRFVGDSYPNITPQSRAQLLHIRPIDLPTKDSLDGLPPLLSVGRGQLGVSPEIVLDKLCVNEEDCYSDTYTFEWRSDLGNDDIFYSSNFVSWANSAAAAATVFKVPTYSERDPEEDFIINVLATRFYNEELGLSPLLSLNQNVHERSDPDVTHSIRIFAPYDMNKRLPPGIYRSKPGTLLIDAKTNDESRVLLELDVSINLSTHTASPTASPTKKTESNGGTGSPTPAQRYHIDWMYGTCVNDGKESSWSPPYPTKSECCSAHMGAEFERCMVADPGSPWR